MITIKNSIQQDGIRRSADLLSSVFYKIDEIIQPGISTLEIDRIVEQTIRAGGGIPAFLGYGGFPASVCTSVNEQVIHGIPNKIPLKNGDVLGCDIGVILNGYYSDACKTFPIGEISQEAHLLLEVTQSALQGAIDVCFIGNRLKDIGKSISRIVEPYGFGIVYSYCGHGVGLELHEEPQIANYYPSKGHNPRLRAGMVLAIEPMLNAGKPEVKVLDDDWTVVTVDSSLSAHFEHSVLIGDQGPEVLTSWGKV